MTNELLRLLLPAGCGAAVLVTWDCLHGLRCTMAKGIVSNFILDIAWWISSAAMFLTCTWHINHTELRFYVFAAFAAGALLYRMTLSKLFRRLFCGIFSVFLKIIQFIFKILLTPALFLYKILLIPIFQIPYRLFRHIKGLRR